MNDNLRIGYILYGFCGGLFGRDSYGNKRVEAIGSDWVVCRETYEGGKPIFYLGRPEDLIEYREQT